MPRTVRRRSLLKAAGISIAPWNDERWNLDLSGLTDAQRAEIERLGVIRTWQNTDGSPVNEAAWRLESVYYWPMVFPAGEAVTVRHAYVPAIGGSAGLFMFEQYGAEPGALREEYAERYCVDPPFENAVRRKLKAMGQPDGTTVLTESWLSYVLTTGANWAGAIGTFHLTVDI